MPTHERRRRPRVTVLGSLYGRLVALDVPVSVRNISLSGMSIETEIPFPIGTSHAFEILLGDETVVRVAGEIIHCNRVEEDADDRYVSGIRFTDEEPENVATLMKQIT